ncbi:glutamine synthetase [Halioglobus japonicus]|uniref:Glutamine synthetase n=1 Tax=Halioglobus japonicus TaxID=930805 RepID=A0AAP8SP53_9GAMM|nr:glutamine synthetase family protein [Halioglobus japonicus]AQA19587.1 glutamine synthetase [Halioglobus japonicus]PLW87345.1 glutamine synthetase [Halioglobus japonicus]GHD08933.1 glutamine synthetase [Halioglobus japonicus]
MNNKTATEVDTFLEQHPDIQMLELLMPDINGILRCKRIHRREFDLLFDNKFKAPLSVPLLGMSGDLYDEGLDHSLLAGDPDQLLLPIPGTLARIPWLASSTAQVLTRFVDMQMQPSWPDPRNVLMRVLERYREAGLRPVVATELEFYLLAPGTEGSPQPLKGNIPGTGRVQQGIQYCMADDLIDCDAFLDDVRKACDLQNVPLTAIHSEFASGQWEINTHHTEDPLEACDHGMLLKRIVKGVARKHGMGATFMAKPFADIAGNGLHIHASIYDADGNNIFACDAGGPPEHYSDTLRHAIGGLADTMDEAMAIFAPNANSYRRFKPGAFAPSSPTWGYNHREVALRIPVSSEHNRRVEHRVAGADANTYLVTAAVLAGMLHGITHQSDPGEPVPVDADLSEAEVTLPRRWDAALEYFRKGSILKDYLGATYCSTFAALRQGESDDYNGQVPDLDYEWYLRAL